MHSEAAEKASMRELAQRGGPWTAEEKAALLDYCESDVEALARLLPAMGLRLDMPRALLRGRYMKAAAHIEHNGVPIDTALSQGYARTGTRSRIASSLKLTSSTASSRAVASKRHASEIA